MVGELYAVLILAFGLGLVHALDADHIIAVSVLSSDQSGRHQSIHFAFQWATGHGVVLLLVSMLFFLLGEAMPVQFSEIAEQLVGLVLIALGLMMFYKIRQARIRLHFHSHEGLLPHAHWHQQSGPENTQHGHKAILIGGLHGMAGSAPLLAGFPIMVTAGISDVLIYIAIFSSGVFLAMVCFGGVFGSVIKKISEKNNHSLKILQTLLAIVSIGIGVRLVSG